MIVKFKYICSGEAPADLAYVQGGQLITDIDEYATSPSGLLTCKVTWLRARRLSIVHISPSEPIINIVQSSLLLNHHYKNNLVSNSTKWELEINISFKCIIRTNTKIVFFISFSDLSRDVCKYIYVRELMHQSHFYT